MHSTASSFYGSMVQAGYMEPFGKFPLPKPSKFQCIYFQALCQQRARLGNHPRKISARRHTRKGFTAKKTTGLPEILEQVLLLVPPPLLLDLVPMPANSIPPCWPSWLGACPSQSQRSVQNNSYTDSMQLRLKGTESAKRETTACHGSQIAQSNDIVHDVAFNWNGLQRHWNNFVSNPSIQVHAQQIQTQPQHLLLRCCSLAFFLWWGSKEYGKNAKLTSPWGGIQFLFCVLSRSGDLARLDKHPSQSSSLWYSPLPELLREARRFPFLLSLSRHWTITSSATCRASLT